jgi:hypothetical protein
LSEGRLRAALLALKERRVDDAADALVAALLDEGRLSGERALVLHLLGLLDFARGDTAQGQERLAAAARLEAGQGQHAVHTAHESSLIFHSGLDKARRYYEESRVTLAKMKNHLGHALCGRTLGEIALVEGRTEDALGVWREGYESLAAEGNAEAEMIGAWREAIERGK